MSDPFVGEIRMFASNFAPQGWALCDGQLLAISSADALFSLLGTIYGGDGRTTFALPDLRGRVPIHMGSGPGLTPRPIGSRGGVEQVTLTQVHMPAHTHTLSASANAATLTADPVGDVSGDTTAGGINLYGGGISHSLNAQALTSAGGGQSHTNHAPFLCVNFIISLFGVYPSRN
jgi:microcystin-dependent protein